MTAKKLLIFSFFICAVTSCQAQSKLLDSPSLFIFVDRGDTIYVQQSVSDVETYMTTFSQLNTFIKGYRHPRVVIEKDSALRPAIYDCIEKVLRKNNITSYKILSYPSSGR
jgi:hypothetical protein